MPDLSFIDDLSDDELKARLVQRGIGENAATYLVQDRDVGFIRQRIARVLRED